MNSCVFIIGGSRTGSELLKGILNKYSDIAFVNEMHLLAPWWLRKDFQTVVKNVYKGFGEKINTDKIIKLIKENKLQGYYWEGFIASVNINKFKEVFDTSDKRLVDVLDAAMSEKINSEGKMIKGAKFPLHYLYIDKLLNWYPDAMIIHTVRDPRAIYYSQSRKYIAEEDSAYIIFKKKLLQFIHISIQSFLTSILHLKYKNRNNYYLSRYEDLIENPRSYFRTVCDFLHIKFNPEMAEPRVFSNSSFQRERGKKKKLNSEAIIKWKGGLSIVEKALITVFTFPSIVIFGYSL